jgi:hypothetical protein
MELHVMNIFVNIPISDNIIQNYTTLCYAGKYIYKITINKDVKS